MTTLEHLRHRRAATRLIGWLLMTLTALQGAIGSAAVVAGPLHTHRSSEASAVLEDVRRARPPAAQREIHVATAFGHFHAGGGAQRHVHRVDDGSVVYLDDGGLAQAQGSDGSGLDHGVASTDGLLPTSVAWIIPPGMQARPLHTSWPWLTFEPEPLERPPRSA